ncbi:NAD-P-binding protein [Artomyces pyxidatus]|uniref:NAD-P-binding protein n=1 Tax=Artomyces pyxidatus TaxID=48021 RepID=A0ACB8TDL8_9AGAM|nr:NAD-P-binding protein [Artomyces pyxidatus]
MTTAPSSAGATPQSDTPFEFDLAKIVGLDEDIQGITNHDTPYPLIDPAPHFAAKTFASKVVLVTGASRGIGACIAQHFARAGAALALVARTEDLLNSVKAGIEADVPGARVLVFAVDVRDTAPASKAVADTVKHFGKLDILVANAGMMRRSGARLAAADPNAWWDTLETNLRGTFNFIHFAIPHLQHSGGCTMVTSSEGAHARVPTESDYSISKQALNRLIEFVSIEYPDVRAFAVNPGNVWTDMSRGSGLPVSFNTRPELVSATMLHLAAGRADWLNGRFVSAPWDLGEVESRYKAAILKRNALVHKLALP